jgi:hypothetical protein
VDGEHKHSLGANVTEGDTHEIPQFDELRDYSEVFADLDAVILTFDRSYTKYVRYCEIKRSDDDFVTLLESDANVDIIDRLDEYHVTTKFVEEN